jgi:hypothetical protein
MPDPRLPKLIVKIAKAEIGIEEINGTNCGPRVNEYKAATKLPPKEPWPWCAAFVDWVVMKAMAEPPPTKYTFERPMTAGAWDLENWSLAQDDSTNTLRGPGKDIEAGDIVIFKHSHVGFATGSPSKKTGLVPTVEGNTDSEGSREGGGVFAKFRKLSEIKTRIRFTV